MSPLPGIVAVVDDDEAVRDSLARLLASAGFRVESFGCGRAFLEACERLNLCCALVDIHMPGLNGLELIRKLAERSAGFPVVAISARGEASLKDQTLDSGAAAFLKKPFGRQELVETVAAVSARPGQTKPDSD